MNHVHKSLIRSSSRGFIVMLALIFVPAWTFRYWQGWAFLAVYVVCSVVYIMWLAKHDPALLKRRTEIGSPRRRNSIRKS